MTAVLDVSSSTLLAFLGFNTWLAPQPFLFTHVAHVSRSGATIVTSALSVTVESGERSSTLLVNVPALLPLAVRIRVLGKGDAKVHLSS